MQPSQKSEVTIMQGICRDFLLRTLEGITEGRITIRDAGGSRTVGQVTPNCSLSVTIEVGDPRFYPAAVLRQSVGVGQAYMDRWWTCDDNVALIRILARNEPALRRFTSLARSLLAPWQRFSLWRKRNTLANSRRNIEAHYDLGNDFFASFLDPSMTYSCAVFESPHADLAAAQTAKLDRICRKLDLAPGDHVLEIGTGWGSFAMHAARQYGCRITTATLSAQQAHLARERIEQAGLQDRITVKLEDYRNLEGRYDKLVSIEMIEAVGTRYFGEYFRRCSDLLRPDGAMLLQAIVVDDRHYGHDAIHVDFIKKFIFPGGVLPSLGVVADRIARCTDLQPAHLEDFTAHYAETLRIWRRNLRAAWPRLLEAGHNEEFLRCWEFYFQYCEGGFLERRTGVVQSLFVKPRCRALPLLQPVAMTWPQRQLERRESHG